MRFSVMLRLNTRATRLLLIILALTLAGCSSTPYRDDHTQYVNLIADGDFDKANFEFGFAGEPGIDLRGLYSQNDTTGASPILYQGGGGLAGMLVQIGTHTSLINTQRNIKLAGEQAQANEQILPLIDSAKEMSLNELTGEYASQWVSLEAADVDTIRIKPIFFSNSDMSKLSLKSIVWLPLQGRSQKVRYRNMIQVYGQTLTESQSQKLVEADKVFLSEVLSSLLKTTLYVVKNELTGQYPAVKSPAETFFIEDGTGKKVVRGSIVAEKCGYQIIQDIHSWFIAYPKPEVTPDTQC